MPWGTIVSTVIFATLLYGFIGFCQEKKYSLVEVGIFAVIMSITQIIFAAAHIFGYP